ncbi:MAG: hypothetical protein JKY42_03240 [Flavobacteriales bacterium]|nr:hypothetical protein [Flavobacteriales bacterium]
MTLRYDMLSSNWIKLGTINTSTDKLYVEYEIPELTADIAFNGNVQVYAYSPSSNNHTALPFVVSQTGIQPHLPICICKGIWK